MNKIPNVLQAIGFKSPCHFNRTFLDFETRNFKERCKLLEIFSCQETMSLLFFSKTWPWMTFMRSEVGGRHTTQLVTTLNIIMEKLLFWSFSYICLTAETNRMEGGRIFFLVKLEKKSYWQFAIWFLFWSFCDIILVDESFVLHSFRVSWFQLKCCHRGSLIRTPSMHEYYEMCTKVIQVIEFSGFLLIISKIIAYFR